MTSAIRTLLAEGLESNLFAGAAAVVATRQGVSGEAYEGLAVVEPAARRVSAGPETLWDLADLTGPLAGTSLLLGLAGEKLLSLDDAAGRFSDHFRKTRFDGVTVRRLLSHSAGLLEWFPLYTRGEGRAAYRRTLAALDPAGVPGRQVRPSSLGYLLLSEIVETVASARIDLAFRERVAAPLGLEKDLLFDLSPEDCRRSAGGETDEASERRLVAELGLTYAGFRSGPVQGDVNDGNAYRRAGGVALNAGLFGSARAVAQLASAWLALDPRLLPERWFAEATAAASPDGEPRWALGWELASAQNSAGPAISEKGYGRAGRTGGSVWIDPENGAVYVLLTNHLHPAARPGDLIAFQRRFHELGKRLEL